MKEILFKALQSKGFVASAANDLSTMLLAAINRCDSNASAKDIDDLIFALQAVKDDILPIAAIGSTKQILTATIIPDTEHPAVGSKVLLTFVDNTRYTTVEDRLLSLYGSDYTGVPALVGKLFTI